MPRPTAEQVNKHQALYQAALDADDAAENLPLGDGIATVAAAFDALHRYEGEMIAAGVAHCDGFHWVKT